MEPRSENMVFCTGPGGRKIWKTLHTINAIRQPNSMGPRKLQAHAKQISNWCVGL